MSIKCMTRVWDLSIHKGSALLLLLAMADYADDVGLCWPGLGTLARKTRISRRQVIRISHMVQETGELWVLHRRHTSNISIVIPGLSLAQLEMAAERAVNRGVIPPPDTRGSDILSPPPQVIGVVTKCHQGGDKIPLGGDKMSLGGDTGVTGVVTSESPDPSLSVIDPSMIQGEFPQWEALRSLLKTGLDPRTYNQHMATAEAEFREGRLIIRPRYASSVPWLQNRLRPRVQSMVRLALESPDLEVVFMEMEAIP